MYKIVIYNNDGVIVNIRYAWDSETANRIAEGYHSSKITII